MKKVKILFVIGFLLGLFASGKIEAGIGTEPLFLAHETGGAKDDPAALKSRVESVLKKAGNGEGLSVASFAYPFDQSIFPPEIVAPEFAWGDPQGKADFWLLSMEFDSGAPRVSVLTGSTTWTPEIQVWETIKTGSVEKKVSVKLVGLSRKEEDKPVCLASMTFLTSKDSVGAPIFFRNVPLPFIYAYNNMDMIKWCLGDIATSTPPRVVLQNMSVCGNCHSFSSDGKKMGMDVDYANDKGAYVVASVGPEVTFSKDKVISWTDYKKEEREPTFGLLARISPDGRYVAATLKDLSIFIAVDDLVISQLFFPFKGILVIYDTLEKTFKALSGADDRTFVQTNPVWSPDGKTIVFAKNKVNEMLFSSNRVKPTTVMPKSIIDEGLARGETFRYDLYKIPFNDGNGGTAVPIAGASANGKSNYFPKISPDGKWIVFCQANSYMLLQPDSKLHIIPIDGGTARPMNCNLSRMNSWHSFSPNGRWLVFSSKHFTPYTQLCLTHIDENGMDSPPIVLTHFTDSDRAANIPEFVNVPMDGLQKITEGYIDEYSHYRMAEDFYYHSFLPRKAEKEAFKALQKNPKYVPAQCLLGIIYENRGDNDLARKTFEKAIEMDPKSPVPYGHLAVFFEKIKEYEKAKINYKKAYEFNTQNIMIGSLYAQFLEKIGDVKGCQGVLEKMVEGNPADPTALSQLGLFYETQGILDKARLTLEKAAAGSPREPEVLNSLGAFFTRNKNFDDAEKIFNQSLMLGTQTAQTYLFLGVMYKEKKDHVKAETALRGGVKLNPNDPEGYYLLSNLLIEMGKSEEAQKVLEDGVKRNPGATEAHVQLSRFLATNKKDLGQAQSVLQKALPVASETSRISVMLGSLYASKQDLFSAEKAYRDAIKAFPSNAEANFLLGNLLFNRKLYEESRIYLEAAIRSDPDRIDAYIELGKLLALKKDYAGAEKVFRNALMNASDTQEIDVYLGKVLVEKNDRKAAEAIFREVLKKDPKNAEACFALALCLSSNAESYAQAIEMLEKGLAIEPDKKQAAELGNLYLKMNDYPKAIKAYELSLQKDPGNATLTAQIQTLKSHLNVKGIVFFLSIVWALGLIVFVGVKKSGSHAGDKKED